MILGDFFSLESLLGFLSSQQTPSHPATVLKEVKQLAGLLLFFCGRLPARQHLLGNHVFYSPICMKNKAHARFSIHG